MHPIAQRLAIILIAVAVLAGCDANDTHQDPRTRYGPAVSVGQGTAQTFVTIDEAGAPMALGIALSETALQGLPKEAVVFELDLPSDVPIPPFDHATLDWNPQGHEPEGIYGLPHFDYHFYTLSREERAQIPSGPDTTAIAAEYIPENYVSTVESYPNMGVHWVDADAPELHGATFDKTLLYGFSRGTLVFIEPMITKAFLESQPDVTLPVGQPAAFQQSGYYPVQYRIRHDAESGTYRMALIELTPR